MIRTKAHIPLSLAPRILDPEFLRHVAPSVIRLSRLSLLLAYIYDTNKLVLS